VVGVEGQPGCNTWEAGMVFKIFGATLLAAGIFFAAIPRHPWADEDNSPKRVLFNQKLFADMGDTVHVEGQVTGEGIGYKVNRYAMTCYRERRECVLTHVDTQGWQAFSIGPPLFFNILRWDKDSIMADLPGLKMPSGHPCGDNPGGTTWYIHRDTQITNIQENFCNLMTGERGFYQWTIEDDPFWHRAAGSK
jgi:hypothetical protein